MSELQIFFRIKFGNARKSKRTTSQQFSSETHPTILFICVGAVLFEINVTMLMLKLHQMTNEKNSQLTIKLKEKKRCKCHVGFRLTTADKSSDHDSTANQSGWSFSSWCFLRGCLHHIGFRAPPPYSSAPVLIAASTHCTATSTFSDHTTTPAPLHCFPSLYPTPTPWYIVTTLHFCRALWLTGEHAWPVNMRLHCNWADLKESQSRSYQAIFIRSFPFFLPEQKNFLRKCWSSVRLFSQVSASLWKLSNKLAQF